MTTGKASGRSRSLTISPTGKEPLARSRAILGPRFDSLLTAAEIDVETFGHLRTDLPAT